MDYKNHIKPGQIKKALRALGVKADSLPPCELPLADRGAASADELVRSMTLAPGGFAVISPGASAAQSYKTPPAEFLAATCQALARRKIRGVVVHGPGELPRARAVVDRAKGYATLAPPTDLPTLAALTRLARLFIGGDSGPLHLACAVGCPVVGVYGPTDPQVNQPWGVPFRTVFPATRRYTGIKQQDRPLGFQLPLCLSIGAGHTRQNWTSFTKSANPFDIRPSTVRIRPPVAARDAFPDWADHVRTSRLLA